MILILAATETELAPFTYPNTHAVGVGAAAAAAETAEALHRCPEAAAAVFVGSCGAVDESAELLHPVLATAVHLASDAVATETGFIPELVPTNFAADRSLIAELSAAIPDAEPAPIYCTDAISRSSARAQALATQCNAQFENLELYGVATACVAAKLPWTTLSLVTNHCNESGHQQWLDNHEAAAERTSKLLSAFLKG